MDSPYWKGPLPDVDVQRRLPVENVPGASRTAFRGQPKSVRLQPGIRVRLAPGILFGFTPECCSPCPGIRMDNHGIDFVIRTQHGNHYDVQVKSFRLETGK